MKKLQKKWAIAVLAALLGFCQTGEAARFSVRTPRTLAEAIQVNDVPVEDPFNLVDNPQSGTTFPAGSFAVYQDFDVRMVHDGDNTADRLEQYFLDAGIDLDENKNRLFLLSQDGNGGKTNHEASIWTLSDRNNIRPFIVGFDGFQEQVDPFGMITADGFIDHPTISTESFGYLIVSLSDSFLNPFDRRFSVGIGGMGEQMTPGAPDISQLVIVRPFPEPRQPGDTNGDGIVDAVDLNTVALGWQTTVLNGPNDGDFNDDGLVNASDLNILALNWQLEAGQSSRVSPEVLLASALVTAIPEPGSTMTLFVLVGSSLILRHRLA